MSHPDEGDSPATSGAYPPPSAGARELYSWKEIAHYLGVHVRTAQKWERERELPVHRLPGARSRVSAHTASLDAWIGRLSGAPRTDLSYTWPLSPSVTVEVRFLGGPISTAQIDLLCEYLRLVKTAWDASPR